MSWSEKVFYGANTQYSLKGCRWIESQSVLTKRHIHHALCGHGGERCLKLRIDGKQKEVLIDGFEPLSETVYQFYGCYWHGCECVRDKRDLNRFKETMEIEELIKKAGYNLVSAWEHDAHFDLQKEDKC